MTELRALTSLRAFAAGMIVLQHLGGRWGAPALAGWNLSAGVSIFFVLSGFILAYRYPTLDTWRARRRFWLKRFARIWPAHAVATLLVLLIVPGAITDLSPGYMLAALAENLAMVQSWIPMPALNYSINGPSWSIATEFFFYLAFPALIMSFRRTWWWKAALSLIVIAILIASYNQIFPLTDTFTLFYYFPIVRIFEFIVGMTAAFAWLRWRDRIRVPALTATLCETALVVCLVLIIMYDSVWIPAYLSGVFGETARLWIWMSVSTVIPSTALITTLAMRRGLVSIALSWWPLVLLGELSYSVYLLHIPLLRSKYFEALPQSIAGVAFVAILIALAAVVFRFIERPARAAISRAGGLAASGLPRRPSAEPAAPVDQGPATAAWRT